MKKHFQSLLDKSHRWYTLSFFLAAILLVISSQMVGTTDNIPGLLLLLGGLVSLFFAFLHPWRISTNFAKLAGVSFGLILLTFLGIFILSSLHKTEYLSEGVVMGFIGLICLPGIVVGVAGAIFWAIRKK